MPRRPPPAVDRFFDGLVLSEEGDHWLFKPHHVGLYGQFRRDKLPHQVKGPHVGAHIFSWEFFRGEIPEGLTIDHLCKVTRCCNPDHLDVVPLKVNILRSSGPAAINAVKTHCMYGHLLEGDNLLLQVDGKRFCRECRRRRSVEWQENNREQATQNTRNSRARKKLNQNLMAGGQGG